MGSTDSRVGFFRVYLSGAAGWTRAARHGSSNSLLDALQRTMASATLFGNHLAKYRRDPGVYRYAA